MAFTRLAASLRELRSIQWKKRPNNAERPMSQWQRSDPDSCDCRKAECGEAGYYRVVCSGQRRRRLAAWSPEESRISIVTREENKESPISEDTPGLSGLKTSKVADWHIGGTRLMPWFNWILHFLPNEIFMSRATVKPGSVSCVSVTEI